jgi:hypothetical protein
MRPPISAQIDAAVHDLIYPSSNDGTGSFAYCGLLYGSSPSDELVANALVMGASMQQSLYPVILMHTGDVPVAVVTVLKKSGLFSEFLEVEYIRGHESLFKKDWFRDVFTKLHVFNLTRFDRVVFMDLDTLCMHPDQLDKLFVLPECIFGAFENSKRDRSQPLPHGSKMNTHATRCNLFNAGLIVVTPNKTLFDILHSDVVSVSEHHVPGMTPEQFYLARVMGHHITNLSQEFNFEVQYHGGVPAYSTWRNTPYENVVLYHFSGGHPFKRLSSTDPEWGCQTEKFYAKKAWIEEFTLDERSFANSRAHQAFMEWKRLFMHVISTLSGNEVDDLGNAISFLAHVLHPPAINRPTRPAPKLDS